MSTINGRVCVVNGTPVDKVFSNGKQVYGRNLLTGTSDNVVHYNSIAGYTVWQSYVTKFNVGDILNVSADISANTTTGTNTNHGDTVLKVFLLSSKKIQIGYAEYRIPEGKTAHAFISKTIPTGTASSLVTIDNGNFYGVVLPDVCAISHQFANTGSVVDNWTPAPEDVGLK
jgi:hypothetical protein